MTKAEQKEHFTQWWDAVEKKVKVITEDLTFNCPQYLNDAARIGPVTCAYGCAVALSLLMEFERQMMEDEGVVARHEGED